MRKLVISFFAILLIPCIWYLIQPNPDFPEPIPGSIQSQEPADTETPLRRSYFTNMGREEVIQHYKSQLDGLPLLRLNYPPEEAQKIIRDQTRSYYLEELTQPFRYSLYVNGFIAQERKDAILVDGVEFYQKVTVRAVPSNVLTRVGIFTASYVLVIIVLFEWHKLWQEIKRMFR